MFVKKSIGLAVFAAAVVLSWALDATAQESGFKDQTLYELKDKADGFLRSGVRRQTSLEEVFENGAGTATRTEKYVSEVIPPDRRRFISEIKTEKGIERTEYIDIGNQSFVRKNDGKWEVFKPQGRGMGSGSGDGSGGESPKIETTSENKLTRGVVVDNRKTDYYETTTTYKFIYPTRTYASHTKKGFWFDAQGRYVKALEENFDGETKTTRRRTTLYEYDPDIKIEAPVNINR